jgi:lipoate-protein ligase A
MSEFVYFGHDRTDVYTALALDDALTEKAAETGKWFIRSYEFAKPSITLGVSEDVSDIIPFEGLDHTRRRTGGSAIWLDESSLAYAIVQPRKSFDPDVENAHHFFAHKIGLALKELGLPEVYIGRRYSISLSCDQYGIISGNSGYNTQNAFLYHGVIVVKQLNIDAISKYIKLRKTETVDEREMISRLPSLEKALGTEISKERLGRLIAHHVSSGNYRNATESERQDIFLRAQQIANETYRNKDWIIGKGVSTRSNLGFCLIALTDEWKEEKFYSMEELQKKFSSTAYSLF